MKFRIQIYLYNVMLVSVIVTDVKLFQMTFITWYYNESNKLLIKQRKIFMIREDHQHVPTVKQA